MSSSSPIRIAPRFQPCNSFQPSTHCTYPGSDRADRSPWGSRVRNGSRQGSTLQQYRLNHSLKWLGRHLRISQRPSKLQPRTCLYLRTDSLGDMASRILRWWLSPEERMFRRGKVRDLRFTLRSNDLQDRGQIESSLHRQDTWSRRLICRSSQQHISRTHSYPRQLLSHKHILLHIRYRHQSMLKLQHRYRCLQCKQSTCRDHHMCRKR